MLSRLAIAVCLALFALPLAARAELPGQPCKQEQVGTTKMADDKQNIQDFRSKFLVQAG